MIVVRLKPLPEIREMVACHQRVLVVGCNTCAAVSLAGGEKEVDTLVQSLALAASMDAGDTTFTGDVITRQCEPEFLDAISMAAGAISHSRTTDSARASCCRPS